MESNEKYYDLVKRFKIFDALLLIIDSWSNLSTETIVNCYRKALENSQIEVKSLISLPEVEQDTNTSTCYPEDLTEEELFIELKNEIECVEEVDEDFHEESCEGLGEERLRLTSLDFYDRLNDIEIYLAESCPELLAKFYSFKSEVVELCPKKFVTILDFLKKR